MEAENTPIEGEVTPPAVPRKRGRPKGLPKTGGRQAGVKNWTAPEIRAELINRSNAIETLCDIVAGRQVLVGKKSGDVAVKPTWQYPTLDQRIRATELVLKKCLPDLAATEITGADGKDLIPGHDAEPPDARQLARAIVGILGKAVVAPRTSPVDGDTKDDDAPADAPAANGHGREIGESQLIGDRGHAIQFVERAGDGRERWAIYSPAGERMGATWGQSDAARMCRELISTGRMTAL